jgi:hypothetical protein
MPMRKSIAGWVEEIKKGFPMTEKTEAPRWVTNVIHTCMGLQRGEKILIVVDEPLGHARDALLAEAAKTDPDGVQVTLFQSGSSTPQ